MTAEYELFALRYAGRPAMRHEHFIGGDPHDGPMPMDYFVWVAKNADVNWTAILSIHCRCWTSIRRRFKTWC